MPALTYSHLSDCALVQTLESAVARERAGTAAVVALIAEVDERRLFAPAGYHSMQAYCVGRLRLSEDAAAKRIHVARKARLFPALLEALADGRVHLSGLKLLVPHLTSGNVDELLSAATHRTRSDIELMIAERFPQSESMALITAVSSAEQVRGNGSAISPVCHGSVHQQAPGPVDGRPADGQACGTPPDAPMTRHPAPAPPTKVAPIAPERFVLQLTIGKDTHDKLRHAQELLSHSVPPGDLGQVLDRALSVLITKLEKRKLGAAERPQAAPRPSRGQRYVPAHVRRAVRERDGGQCTFVADDGHRCEARNLLEYDHIDPVARGGRSTVENIRLRCRAHNQLEAERVFGAGFMEEKRGQKRGERAETAPEQVADDRQDQIRVEAQVQT